MRIEVENRYFMRNALATVCEFLSESGIAPERVFDSKLIISELVGNVFTLSKGKASVSVTLLDEFVQIEIGSTVPFIPPKTSKLSEVFSEHGRGLFLVDSICHERGVTEDGHIKVLIKIN